MTILLIIVYLLVGIILNTILYDDGDLGLAIVMGLFWPAVLALIVLAFMYCFIPEKLLQLMHNMKDNPKGK